MARYHINPKTGNPGLCKAMVSCPFGDMETDHYSSKEEAQKAFEKAMGTGVNKEEANPVYTFPSYKLSKALNSIEKANRKAEKAGIPERFTYEIERYEISKMLPNGLETIEERVRMKLNRPTVEHEGWKFAGTMTWDPEAGLITRMAPGQELLEKPKAELCDVCKTTRHRNDTYIVQKDGEQQQVGSNCLKRFMGIRPAGLWMLDFEPEFSEQDDDYFASPRERLAEQRQPVEQLIGIGLAITEKHGWVSRSMEEMTEKTSTASLVNYVLGPPARTAEGRQEQSDLIARGKNLEKEAKKVLKEAQAIEGDSEYAENMRKLASASSVSMRNMPLLLSAIGNHERAKAKAVQAKARAKSEWQGGIGEKLSVPKVTVANVKHMTSSYGYQTTSSQLITLQDEEGNIYKTFYSGAKAVKTGESYNLTTGTVKKHEEWQGAQETLLTRVKLETARPNKMPPTKLPKASAFRAAWTPEEADKLANDEHKRIVKEMKSKAGRGNWDKDFNRPQDPQLIKEMEELQKKTNDDYQVRYRELTQED